MATSNRQSLSFILSALLVAMVAGCSHSTVAQKKEYYFWPPMPDEPRVQFLTSFNSSTDVEPPQSNFDKMIYGEEAVLPIGKPYGVASWDGRIYVCDLRSHGVTVLDLRKRVTRVLGAGGMGDIDRAIDIFIAPDGAKYVVDAGRNAIAMFDAQDRFINLLAPKDLNPVSVAAYGNELFVADLKAQMIKVLDRNSGKLLRTIGEPGSDDGQFIMPLCVRFDNDGNLLVDDVMKCRIQKFTRDGKLLAAFGQISNRPGDFVRPKHLAVDSNGFTYIADAAFNNVQIFDEQNKILMYFGSAGAHPGAMDLPAGVTLDEKALDLFAQYVHPAFQAERLIIVTNQFGPNKVAVYALGHLKPGKTLADITPSRGTIATGVEDAAAAATQPSLLPAIGEEEASQRPTTRPASPNASAQ